MITSTAGRGSTACGPSSSRAASSCRRGRRTRLRPAIPSRASATARTSGSSAIMARAWRRSVSRVGALPRGGTWGRPADRGRHLVTPTARPCSTPPSCRASSRPGSTAWSSPSGAACAGKPAPDSFLAGADGARHGAGQRRRSSRTRFPGSRPVRPGTSATSWASTGSARPTPCAAHGADVVVTDLAELLEARIDQPASPSTAGRCAGDGARPRVPSSGPSRCSRCPTGISACAARWTRASRAGCRAPTSTASTSSARCRMPRPATATRRPARRSSTSPTARSSGCSSRTSHSICGTASCVEHERVLDFRTGTLRRDAVWASPTGTAVRISSTRLVSFTQRADRRDPVRGRAARRRRCASSLQSDLLANEHVPRAEQAIHASRPRSTRRWRPSTTARDGCRGGARAPHRAVSGLRVAAGDGPRGRLPATRCDCAIRRRGDLAGVTVAVDCSRGSGSPDQVRRLRLVGAAVGAGAARPGRRRARRGHADRLGRPARRAARRTSTTSGRAPTSRSTATPSCSRRCGSRCSTCCRPARAAETPGDPGQGPDRPRLRRPHASGTPRRSCCRCSPTPCPTRPRDALRWRHSTLDQARERAAALGLRGRGVPVAHDQRRGVLRLLAGRHRGVPRQRRHRRRGRPLRATRPATTTSSATSASSCWSRPRGCGARSDTTTCTATSASTASPGPDEYSAIADNNVYTNLMAQRNLRGGRGAASATRTRARELGVDDATRSPRGATRADRDGRPVRRRARRASAGRGLHRARSAGTSTARRRRATRCCCTIPYFDLYRKQVVKQADLVLAMYCARRCVHARAEGAQLRLLRAAHGARLVAVGVHARRCSPPRSGISTSRTTTSRRPPS